MDLNHDEWATWNAETAYRTGEAKRITQRIQNEKAEQDKRDQQEHALAA